MKKKTLKENIIFNDEFTPEMFESLFRNEDNEIEIKRLCGDCGVLLTDGNSYPQYIGTTVVKCKKCTLKKSKERYIQRKNERNLK